MKKIIAIAVLVLLSTFCFGQSYVGDNYLDFFPQLIERQTNINNNELISGPDNYSMKMANFILSP